VANDDLNNCRTLGWYFSGGGTQGSAITPTLKNCPVTGGSFSMRVIKAANNSAYYMQILYSISDTQGGIYTRVVDSGGQEFKSWFKYTGTELTQ
jgi:hypothetical protein